jgi:hypothetical protein
MIIIIYDIYTYICDMRYVWYVATYRRVSYAIYISVHMHVLVVSYARSAHHHAWSQYLLGVQALHTPK